jgi:hypothetical protein
VEAGAVDGVDVVVAYVEIVEDVEVEMEALQ